MSRFDEVVARLSTMIAQRQGADPAGSYTAQLLANRTKAAKKLGEEALETAIAAVQDDPDALAAESADLIYHWLVVLAVSRRQPRPGGREAGGPRRDLGAGREGRPQDLAARLALQRHVERALPAVAAVGLGDAGDNGGELRGGQPVGDPAAQDRRRPARPLPVITRTARKPSSQARDEGSPRARTGRGPGRGRAGRAARRSPRGPWRSGGGGWVRSLFPPRRGPGGERSRDGVRRCGGGNSEAQFWRLPEPCPPLAGCPSPPGEGSVRPAGGGPSRRPRPRCAAPRASGAVSRPSHQPEQTKRVAHAAGLGAAAGPRPM
jgi:phosphoribosyl-ATP pyrophosphohydrolase